MGWMTFRAKNCKWWPLGCDWLAGVLTVEVWYVLVCTVLNLLLSGSLDILNYWARIGETSTRDLNFILVIIISQHATCTARCDSIFLPQPPLCCINGKFLEKFSTYLRGRSKIRQLYPLTQKWWDGSCGNWMTFKSSGKSTRSLCTLLIKTMLPCT